MDYMAEATRLFFIVVVLVVAYFGVMVWTRRVNNQNHGGGGVSGLFGGGGLLGGGSSGPAGESSSANFDDSDGSVSIPTAKKAADLNKGRFELTGGDAETAAKVLKRMLKQDSGLREGDSE